MITENRSIVTAWAVVSVFFALSGAFDFGAIALRSSVLAETAFWAMAVALVGAFIVAPLLPTRGALARFVPIACFAAAWVSRRHDIAAPSATALVLVAVGLIWLGAVSTVYSSWIRTIWTPASTFTSSTRGPDSVFTTLISPLRSK